jgi:hypothetical protein
LDHLKNHKKNLKKFKGRKMKTKNVACEKIIDVFQPTIFLK